MWIGFASRGKGGMKGEKLDVVRLRGCSGGGGWAKELRGRDGKRVEYDIAKNWERG